jgi:hypothetical protein
VVRGARGLADATAERIAQMQRAVRQTPAADPALLGRLDALARRVADVLVEIRGDASRERRSIPTPLSLEARVDLIADALPYTTAPPTATQRDSQAVAEAAADRVLAELRALSEDELPAIDAELERAGAPWTPGRVPGRRGR